MATRGAGCRALSLLVAGPFAALAGCCAGLRGVAAFLDGRVCELAAAGGRLAGWAAGRLAALLDSGVCQLSAGLALLLRHGALLACADTRAGSKSSVVQRGKCEAGAARAARELHAWRADCHTDAEGAMTAPPSAMRRVTVVGPSGSGKSTLGARLAAALRVPYIELDALYWKPGWVESPDEEFIPRLHSLAAGDGWVAAGGYWRQTSATLWPRADTVVWLDLPLAQTLSRLMRRCWRRWRTREVLWGTNVERLWPQFKLWDGDASLFGYTLRTHRSKRRRYLDAMADPRWRHVRFVHLRSPAAIEAFAREIEAAARSPQSASR